MTLFTVLFPIYFKDKYNHVEEALKSIINQTLVPDEILILVDGKIEKSVHELIEHYKVLHDELIKIIYFEKNRGLGLVLRDGVNLSKNDLIARMDSDDIARKDRFEKQIEFFQSNEVDVLGGQIVEFSNDAFNQKSEKKVPCSYSDIKKYARKRNPVNHMTVIFNKKAILNSGNYNNFNGFEDYVLWLAVLKNGFKIMNLPDVLVDVRAGEELIMRRRGLKYIKNEYSMQKYCYVMNYITLLDFLINIVVRTAIRVLPLIVVQKVYEKILRSKS